MLTKEPLINYPWSALLVKTDRFKARSAGNGLSPCQGTQHRSCLFWPQLHGPKAIFSQSKFGTCSCNPGYISLMSSCPEGKSLQAQPRIIDQRFLKRFLILLATFFLLTPGISLALSTDKDQPMDVESDRVDIDDNTGVNNFRGNAVVTQGSMRIEADTITVYKKNKDNVDVIIATGNRVVYRQRPDNKPEDIIAKAMKMEYYVQKDKIILLKKALVIQGRDTFTGDNIEYDMKHDIVLGKTSPSGKDRVKITIQPKKKTQTPESPANKPTPDVK